MVEDISLYFHIPLCARKCPYCHFYTLPNRASFAEALMEGLALEWERVRPFVSERKPVSVYFGGGTPWLLGAQKMGRLLGMIPLSDDCEVTLEANPEEVDDVRPFVDIGVNRLSLGVQSLDDGLLAALGRCHTSQRGIDAVWIAKEGGIDNISVDLMVDVPTQTLLHVEATLELMRTLPLTHVSLYNLTIEPHTVFHKRRALLEPLIPSDSEGTKILLRTIEGLASVGFSRYEISAFAKEEKLSRHNIGYWTHRTFLGLGPSAWSFAKGTRFQNAPHLNRWLAALRQGRSGSVFREALPYPQNVLERLAIGLRVLSGVDLRSFSLPEEARTSLRRLAQDGYLAWDAHENVVQLTEKGKLFYDTVATAII